jgi:hypothetical protein
MNTHASVKSLIIAYGQVNLDILYYADSRRGNWHCHNCMPRRTLIITGEKYNQ